MTSFIMTHPNNDSQSESHRKQIRNRLRNRIGSESEPDESSEPDTETDAETETEAELDSDWSDGDDDVILTSANLDDSSDGAKGRARQEIQFYNQDNDRISFFRQE